jgi:hypothetical protein
MLEVPVQLLNRKESFFSALQLKVEAERFQPTPLPTPFLTKTYQSAFKGRPHFLSMATPHRTLKCNREHSVSPSDPFQGPGCVCNACHLNPLLFQARRSNCCPCTNGAGGVGEEGEWRGMELGSV